MLEQALEADVAEHWSGIVTTAYRAVADRLILAGDVPAADRRYVRGVACRLAKRKALAPPRPSAAQILDLLIDHAIGA
jgi:hypothetical protein